jgi:hypothetical protein
LIAEFILEGAGMETKRKYRKPELKTKVIELGIFGEYGAGGDVPGGGDGGPRPVKITNPFDYMID